MQIGSTSSIDSSADKLRGRTVLTVLVVAALLRAAWALAVPVVPVSDSVRYDFFAQRLATGLGYTEADGRATAYWPVGPSFLYSLGYRLLGSESEQRFLSVSVINLVLGAASVGLTMLLARRWFSNRVAVAAGWLMALWPSLIQFTTVLNSEIPMIFCMLASIAVWTELGRSVWTRGLLAGVLIAGTSFMRPTALLLPVVLCVSDLLRRTDRLRTLGAAAMMMAAMAAAILPWSWRNYRAFGEFVLISTNGGPNFWMGNNPETTGFYQSPPWTDFDGEVDRDRGLRARALAYIREDPAAFLQRTLVKAVRLHERESIGVVWNRPGLERALARLGLPATTVAPSTTIPRRVDEEPPGDMASPAAIVSAGGVVFGLKLLSNVYWWAVLLLAVFGVLRLLLRGPLFAVLFAPPTLIWAYFIAVHAVTVIQDRYHFAAVPLLASLAAAIRVGVHGTAQGARVGRADGLVVGRAV